MTLKSIYDIDLKSADGAEGFLNQYKGKVTLIANTTVGCGNANQMEVLQMLQNKYADKGFEVIAIPTNDYCGPGITKGKWSKGISCGLDSQNYGRDVYNTTFEYSEMVASNPNSLVSETVGKNGLGEDHKEPHELYKEIAKLTVNHDVLYPSGDGPVDDGVAVVYPSKLGSVLSKIDNEWYINLR